MPRKLSLVNDAPPVHKLPVALRSQTLNVALVGCGGNGSQMLYKLARLHFALRETRAGGLNVCAFDPDIVSEANIGRQLFAPDDVGRAKSHVLINRINLTYGLDWKAKAQEFDGHRSGDILISCVDSAQARRDIWRQITHSQTRDRPHYWLDLGNLRSEGQVILGEVPVHPESNISAFVSAQEFVDGNWNPERKLQEARRYLETNRLRTVVELFPELLDARRKEDNTPSCSLAEALNKQSLFVNDAMASWAAQMLDALLREREIGFHGVFINLKTAQVRPLPVPALVAAPVQLLAGDKPKRRQAA